MAKSGGLSAVERVTHEFSQVCKTSTDGGRGGVGGAGGFMGVYECSVSVTVVSPLEETSQRCLCAGIFFGDYTNTEVCPDWLK